MASSIRPTIWCGGPIRIRVNALANDAIGGTIGVAQLNQWRAHFGQTAGSGAGSLAIAAVPEPATWSLMILAAVGAWTRQRRRTWPRSNPVTC